MNEEFLIQVKEYLDKFSTMMKETLDRVDSLEDVLYNKVINPAAQLEAEYNTGLRRDEFKGKYGEQLSQFNDKLKAIEGDDNFDLADKAFADYDALEEKPDEAEYVATLVAKVSEQLEKIAKVYGVSNVEAEHNESEGETEVEAEGETIAEAKETDESESCEETAAEETMAEETAAEESAESNAESEVESETEAVEEEELIDTAEELAEDIRMLEEELAKYR